MVIVDLADHDYRQLVIEVEDPEAVVKMLDEPVARPPAGQAIKIRI